MNRVNRVMSHLAASSDTQQAEQQQCASSFGKVGTKSPDDVVIVSALRTPICRARKGKFKDTTPDTLLGAALAGVVKQSGAKYDILGDVVVGNVQLGGSYAGPARMAMFTHGFPVSVPINCVNRQCSSGLQAVANIANSIAVGEIDAGIAAGVESMTAGGGVSKGSKMKPPPVDLNAIMSNKLAREAMTPMGVTSENVAARYGITREMQDTMAVESNRRALAAIQEGRFKSEIIPLTVTVKDAEGKKHEVTVDTDEGPRKSTVEGLSKLRTVFKKVNGTTTAGNASQVSDGAAAVLLARRSVAEAQGLPIIGVMRGFQVVGVKPDEMGVGPAFAIPAVLKKTNLDVKDIDIFELNEAFASQAVYCVNKLGLDMAKVNPNGGAIALGHPLGCTGARQVATLLAELKRSKGKVGVVSMCIGTGMGAAAVFEAEY